MTAEFACSFFPCTRGSDEGNSHSPDEEPAGRAALHASAGPAPAGGSGTFLLLGGNEGTEGKVFHANLARLLAASQLYMEAGRAFAQCASTRGFFLFFKR